MRLIELKQAELKSIDEKQREHEYRGRIHDYFPEDGPLRRDLYEKHMEFFKAGSKFIERCFMAGNRVGKSESGGGYETVLHLTGLYPDWWEGRRFDNPVRALAAGDTSQTTRDIIQKKMLGDVYDMGKGLIPKDCIGSHSSKAGVSGGIDTIKIRHVSGGDSELIFRSYDQGRRIFQGIELDVVWFDEEPPLDVYSEALIRTMTTGGITMLTFTPLSGMSETVMSFLPQEYQLES